MLSDVPERLSSQSFAPGQIEFARDGTAHGRRLILFLLSPRLIDFDTYLPTAMELQRLRPKWIIRFVTFSGENHDFIARNPTLVTGIERCGSLHYLGSEERRHRLGTRVRSFVRLASWLLAYPRPVLLMARPFAQMPYSLLYALARFRGGRGYVLAKTRSPDVVHRIVWQNRDRPAHQRRSLLTRLLGSDVDGVIDYHADQSDNVQLAARYGRITAVPWRRIGMPHLFPAWRHLIEAEVRRERAAFVADGVPPDAEIYCMVAAKPWSAINLRTEDAIERVFHQVITALCRLRPKAVVLIRPHPKAVDEPYIGNAIETVGANRARISFAHPEVLFALSHRAIFNNPSNIMFTCFPARMIDCSDYPESHRGEFGDTSLAHGYGPVYVNPTGHDFEHRFARALSDDSVFDEPEIRGRRDKLLAESPPDLRPLLELVDNREPVREPCQS